MWLKYMIFIYCIVIIIGNIISIIICILGFYMYRLLIEFEDKFSKYNLFLLNKVKINVI